MAEANDVDRNDDERLMRNVPDEALEAAACAGQGNGGAYTMAFAPARRTVRSELYRRWTRRRTLAAAPPSYCPCPASCSATTGWPRRCRCFGHSRLIAALQNFGR